MNSDVDIGTLPLLEHFRYWNYIFQSDIFVFVSDIGITDVDVGCRISPTSDIEIDVDAHLCVVVLILSAA
jgi:hypothetical protein